MLEQLLGPKPLMPFFKHALFAFILLTVIQTSVKLLAGIDLSFSWDVAIIRALVSMAYALTRMIFFRR